MKKNIALVWAVWLLIILFAACNTAPATPTQSRQSEILTQIVLNKTTQEVIETKISTAKPSPFPTHQPPPPTRLPGDPTLIAERQDKIKSDSMGSNERVYVDPHGWYGFDIPPVFKADKIPSGGLASWSKPNQPNVLEVGYLPAFGYTDSVLNVCEWIMMNTEGDAPEPWGTLWQISSKEYSTENDPDCIQYTRENGQLTTYYIYENPDEKPDYRFTYIKTSEQGYIPNFIWLKKPERATPIDDLSTIFKPLQSDELAGWEKSAPFLKNITISEYKIEIDGENRYASIPEKRQVPWINRKTPANKLEVSDRPETDLEHLGYEFIRVNDGNLTDDIYKDGKLFIEKAVAVHLLYTFKTSSGKPIYAFIVEARKAGSNNLDKYLIENGVIKPWVDNWPDPGLIWIYDVRPVLYHDQLLWLHNGQVVNSDGEIVARHKAQPGYGRPDAFEAHKDAWVLKFKNVLIINGENINLKIKAQDVISYDWIHSQPAAIFRKDRRPGLYYDGKILPLDYTEIKFNLDSISYKTPEQWYTLESPLNRPAMPDPSANSLYFLGLRNGEWYYVVVQFP